MVSIQRVYSELQGEWPPGNENAPTPNHSTGDTLALVQPRIPRSAAPNTVPSMVDTRTTPNGTNAPRVAAEEPRSEPEPALNPRPYMVVSPVACSEIQQKVGIARLNPAPDTPSSENGQAPEHRGAHRAARLQIAGPREAHRVEK